MSLGDARALANAVLMEGYALYPYRASAPKNRYRWTFGVLAPRPWSEAGGCEPWWLEAQVLVAGAPTEIRGQLRCFQVERRRTFDAVGREVSQLVSSGGDLALAWEEGVLHELDVLLGARGFVLAGSSQEEIHDYGRVVRERHRVVGSITAQLTRLAVDPPLHRLSVRVENFTPWRDLHARREQAMAASLASTHLVLEAVGGDLLSALDPPEWAIAQTAACTNTGTYPVLVGSQVMLCAPFALYDHAKIAPESTGDLCDASEIDELLVLRARTMTAAEKREARATDPRAQAIVDRAEAMTATELAELHGARRDIVAGEMVPKLGPGAKVRVKPASRFTDAQDALYAGHLATVAEVKRDIDGSVFVAVTIDDDPAAELNAWYGRYHHYRLDEVELL